MQKLFAGKVERGHKRLESTEYVPEGDNPSHTCLSISLYLSIYFS